MIADHPDVVEGSSGKYQNWELVDPEKWVAEVVEDSAEKDGVEVTQPLRVQVVNGAADVLRPGRADRLGQSKKT